MGPLIFFVFICCKLLARCYNSITGSAGLVQLKLRMDREMTNSELVFKLEISVSGAEGWHERMANAIESIAVLVREEKMLSDRGDGSDHTYDFNITLGNPR